MFTRVVNHQQYEDSKVREQMNTELEIGDERWQMARDIIVESVISGNFPKKYEAAKSDFEYGLEERDGPNHDESVVDIGAWISSDAVPNKFDLDVFDSCLGWLDEERADAIENGASPTQEEFSLILENWLSDICEFQESAYFDAFGVYPLVHSNGKQCFFIVTMSGYSMSYSESVLGYFSDIELAHGHLRQNGLICADVDDNKVVMKFVEKCLSAE
jgi:hypothetical protein